MSLAEIERFAAALKSNEALRVEADKAQADRSHPTPMARLVAFGATKSYAFTADDVKAYAKARELSDAELDGVAGGRLSESDVRSKGANDTEFYSGAELGRVAATKDGLVSDHRAVQVVLQLR